MIARNSCMAIFLTCAAAYAGAGANGGNGVNPTSQNTYQLVFGTISPASGTPFDFLATDANIDVLLSDFSTGGDSGVPPTGLDPRVLAGVAGLLLSPVAGPYTPVFTDGTTTEPIPLQFVSQLTDSIWFSNGALGQISPASLTDPTQILAIAQTLGVFSGSGGPLTPSPSSAGSVDFGNITVQIANSQVQTLELDAHINLQELDFSSASQTSVPEPSSVWFAGIGLAALVFYRKRS